MADISVNNFQVYRHGDYHFTLKKTSVKRLPTPYTKPSCVPTHSVEAEGRNMFGGKCSEWYFILLNSEGHRALICNSPQSKHNTQIFLT